ncbi:uncharacterized protein F5147DRAFT_781516 [Suillus discolor]|uniref:Uncharacterized protein n=1 Tax=Suillus discolor TaxID=1912936 RepID=A0A9P7JLK5_9AGAM|nr:uncharacterized protein F5147DRAFT_781516 [Suillus discolor]KAG2086819.1 hypothetical protein F5147DRAFT_781516 [Suillus discolor]
MTPEVANDVLDTMLATLQSLIKCCIHLKQGDPEALKLSDEIARRVAKDLRLYGGSATPFSPQLLSCAAVVRQYSKGGTFESLPDWNSVVDDDPCIKSHLRFHKTLDYRPLAAVGTLPILKVRATGLSSIIKPLTVPAAVRPFIKQAPTLEANLALLSPLPASLELEPLTLLAPSVTSSTPATTKYKLFVPGNMSNKVKVTPHSTNDKKRKAEEDNTNSADTPRSPSRSRKQNLKKIKKLSSHYAQDQLRIKKNGTTKETSLSAGSEKVSDPETQDAIDMASDDSFWDAETRPRDWGLDSTIATEVEHSIRYHPQKCDKCKKLGIPCITKVTCAINGMGVRDRLQAEAKAKAVARVAKPPKRSQSRVPKVRAVNKTLKKVSPAAPSILAVPSAADVMEDNVEHGGEHRTLQKAAPSILAVPSSSHVMEDIVEHGMAPAEATLSPPIATPMMINHPMEANHPAEPEPTAKDILQAIWDLESKFDLLATNEWVDALDAKVVLVEEVFGHRLAMLEQRMNSSDAQWKAMSSSVGHLTNCLRDHKDDLEAHRPRVNTTAYAPPQHPTAQLPAWLHGTGGVDDLGISTVGRQWTHAWDPSVATGVQGCLETSASAMWTGYPPDTPVLQEASIESS